MSFYFRIVTYTESTKPIIDHYDDLGLVRKVCASGTPDQVWLLVGLWLNTNC